LLIHDGLPCARPGLPYHPRVLHSRQASRGTIMADLAPAHAAADTAAEERLAVLQAIEQKLLWLSSWTIHNANHLRPSRDQLKVGGHQASSASLVTLMTALYFDVLRPQDRVAVKPHASPVFHAIQYLFGNQTLDKLQRFRALG